MYANSPIAMPSPVRPDDQPHDIESWMKQTLLGGQGGDQIDPSISMLLKSLLGQLTPEMSNGPKI